MRTKPTHPTSRLWKIVGSAALSLTFLAPALAGSGQSCSRDPHRQARQHHGRHAGHGTHFDEYQNYGPGWAHGRFVTPAHLSRQNYATYRPYLRGSLFYRAHRHHHTVYDFPVYTTHGYAYRPHYYCNGNLYREPTRHRHSHFQLSLRF